MSVLLWSMVAAAACPDPVSTADLGQAMSMGEAAYLNMEEDIFRQSWQSVQEMIPCLQEPIGTSQVIAYYRMNALYAFIERDEAEGVAAFRALLATAPQYSLSPSLAPENHPLQAWRTSAFESQSTLTSTIALPRNKTVWIDGEESNGVVPTDRPYILQASDRDGNVAQSTRMQTGQIPDMGAPQRSIPSSMWVSVGAAALAGGSYVLARQSESTFLNPATPTGDLAGLRGRTNALSALSIGASATAVGFGAVAVFSGEW